MMSAKKQSVVECGSCGHPIKAGSSTCTNCGAASMKAASLEQTEFPERLTLEWEKNAGYGFHDTLKALRILNAHCVTREYLLIANVSIESHETNIREYLDDCLRNSYGWNGSSAYWIKRDNIKIYQLDMGDYFRYITHEFMARSIVIFEINKEHIEFLQKKQNDDWKERKEQQKLDDEQRLVDERQKKYDAYQKRLRDWEKLSSWKRKITQRPEPGPSIME